MIDQMRNWKRERMRMSLKTQSCKFKVKSCRYEMGGNGRCVKTRLGIVVYILISTASGSLYVRNYGRE